MFKKISQAALLSNSVSGKCVIVFWYLYLTVRAKLGFGTFLKQPKKLKLEYKGKNFDFYIDSKNDFDVLSSVFGKEEWKVENASDVTCVLDLGGYTGATSIYFALRYPNAIIYSFEPEPNNQIRFELNTQNYRDRIILIKKLVSSQSNKKVKFFSQSTKTTNLSASVFEVGTDSLSTYVVTISLDDFIKEEGLNRIDIIKFNIEGSEFEVFENCNSLNIVNCLIGEIHPDLAKKGLKEFESIFAKDFDTTVLQVLKLDRKLVRLDRRV